MFLDKITRNVKVSIVGHSNDILKSDDRRVKIIAAAYDAFCTYGFKRTSMDDIARGAGISRPALYQSFANKSEIFKAAVERFFDEKKIASEEVFFRNLGVRETLCALIEISFLTPHRALYQTPHGRELLGMKTEFAPELFSLWKEHSREIIRRALLLAPDLSTTLVDDLTDLLMNTIEGAKSQNPSMEELEAAVASALRVVNTILEPS